VNHYFKKYNYGAASAVSAGAGALSAVTGVVSMISANKQKSNTKKLPIKNMMK
jgi:hypothetical protein